ncbi:MAG: hypothetical protein WBK51_02395 [Polaromonas sp.]
MTSKLERLAWILLGGLIVWGYQVATEKRAEKATIASASYAQRKLATQEILKAGSKTTISETPQGTVIELSIPKASFGGSFLEIKRCIIWRDAVTKTAALSCEKDEIETRNYSSENQRLSDE